jgi:hypothetical protein
VTFTLATDLAVFADGRSVVQVRREKELFGPALYALRHYGTKDWYATLLNKVEKLVRSQYHEDTERWTSPRLRTAQSGFRKQAEKMLRKTHKPEPDHIHEQAMLIARSLSVAAINVAIETAAADAGQRGLRKVWVSMEDDRVRPTHAEADGQTVPLGRMFTVGGFQMRRPGDLRAPIQEWVNCRCVVAIVGMPDAVAASLSAATEGATMADDDEFPAVPEEERLDYVDAAVPFWGVLAPEGEWSGDGRRFRSGALRARPLPLPLAYQRINQPGHDSSFKVANIERTWRRDDGMVYGSGHFLTVIPEVDEVVGVMAESGGRMGVSIDADDGAMEMVLRDGRSLEEAMDAMGPDEGIDMDDILTEFTTARVSGATLCNIPAFHQAFIALGDVPEEFADGEDLAIESRDEAEAAAAAATFVSEKPWDGSASRFTPEQWKRSCILHLSDSLDKSDHKLPIREPGGAISRAGVHAAAGRISQVDAPPEKISAAKSALRGAYKSIGEDPPESLTAAGPVKTEDGPGWLTHPIDTDRLRDYWTHGKGAAKIGWGVPGDFNRCRMHLAKYVKPQFLNGYCANRHYDALGFWPGRPVSAETVGMSVEEYGTLVASGTMAPSVSLVDDSPAMLYPPSEWFTDPHLIGPSPLTITEDGRVFGHIATWGTCHIGFKDTCVTPPRSMTNYAYFRTGAALTAEGTQVPVGNLTMDTGHAGIRASAKTAMAHYDNTGTAVANVAAGEDEFGIWVAGAIAPGVAPEKVVAMRAGAISGDWRDIGGNLELIAGLVVNVPGFPIPRTALAASGGHQTALVAAGMVLTASGEPATPLTVEEIVERTLNAAAERAAAAKRMQELAATRAAEEKAKMDALAARAGR